MPRDTVGPASTSYKDWIGTAAAENSMIRNSGDLYELAGVDVKTSTIVAVNMWASSHGEDPDWDVSVYVADRTSNDVRKLDDVNAQEAEFESLPVRHIELHGVSLEDVVKCMKVVEFQLRRPDYKDMHVVARGDHPTQD